MVGKEENEVIADKWENRIYIGGLIAIFVVIIVSIIAGTFEDISKSKKHCQAFCNCSITQDCPYTFDYDKVKDCECR